MKILPTLKKFVRALLRRGPAEPEDPYSPVRVPVRRGPPGGAMAVALEEPEETTRLTLFARKAARTDS